MGPGPSLRRPRGSVARRARAGRRGRKGLLRFQQMVGTVGCGSGIEPPPRRTNWRDPRAANPLHRPGSQRPATRCRESGFDSLPLPIIIGHGCELLPLLHPPASRSVVTQRASCATRKPMNSRVWGFACPRCAQRHCSTGDTNVQPRTTTSLPSSGPRGSVTLGTER
jgi:hypothetical protein